MTKSEFQPKPGSTSSDQTGDSARSDAILTLGKKLVDELGLEPSVDTLGRWMAHHIAGLIHDAENANVEERPERVRLCCDLILNLWSHRYTLQSGTRPCGELGPLLRTLESLDPESRFPRYARAVRGAVDDGEEQNETKTWLELVDGLDYSAKVLIRYCLAQATETTINKSAQWVALAKAAGVGIDAEGLLVDMISAENEMLKATAADEATRKRTEDRIMKLEAFAKMAMEVVSRLRQGGK